MFVLFLNFLGMRQVEIEERYLCSMLSEAQLKGLVPVDEPDHSKVYCNFTIDHGVTLRAKKQPLRVRLYGATPAEVLQVMNAVAEQRLAVLKTLSDGRQLEFTLKGPTATAGKEEIEDIAAIAKYLDIGSKVKNFNTFASRLAAHRMTICGAILTERKQWDLENLNSFTTLSVTQDRSRCHHQLANNEAGRLVVEVEACVKMSDKTDNRLLDSVASGSETQLHDFIKSRLGVLPPSVMGSVNVCLLKHEPGLGKLLVAAKAIKPSQLARMVATQELTAEQASVFHQ